MPLSEEIAAADGEAHRLLPEVPALLVPDADGEAERVGAFGQRQRSEPADEVLLVGQVVGGADRIGRAEADHLLVAVEQLELDGVRVLGRSAARPEMDLHHLAGVEKRRDRPCGVAGLDAAQVIAGRRVRAIGRARLLVTRVLVHPLVAPRHLGRAAVVDHVTALQHHRPRAQLAHAREVVAHQEHGAPLAAQVLHPAEALVPEMQVPDRQHFVDDQNLRLEVRGDGKRQPHVHPARIGLHWRMDELLELGEGDDGVELADDLRAKHAEDRPVEEDVLPARQIRMEAGADLEEARDAAAQIDVAFGRRGNPRQDLPQRALAGAVRPTMPMTSPTPTPSVTSFSAQKSPARSPRPARCWKRRHGRATQLVSDSPSVDAPIGVAPIV